MGTSRKGVNTKHGICYTDLYRVYYAMKGRCYNCNNKSYKNYGGRGIKICDEWLGENGVVEFYKWSINNGYKKGLRIDRINNNGNYEPSNCRYVNASLSAQNERTQINSTTGISGVWYRKDKKDYRVTISVNNKRKSCGCYKTLEEAKEARKQSELKYWGWTKVQ